MPETLTLRRKLPDGRVLAINRWRGGAEELMYSSEASFLKAKEAVEVRGEVPFVDGFIEI